MSETLLEVQDLSVQFNTEDGVVEALDGVNLTLEKDEVLGVIGESGCGKTVTVLSVMGLLDSPPAEVTGGKILFQGQDLLELSDEEMNGLRGDEIAMIYQDPMSSLNPTLKIGFQVAEPLLIHTDLSKGEAYDRAIEMLEACGLADADRIVDQYPHSLSGGMRQRVVIAMALISEPKLLIADEPTTALDVTIQAQIVDLLHELQRDQGMSMIFITHDLPLVGEIADRISVMYAGNVVESCTVEELFENPLHPYTRKLSESIPKQNQTYHRLPTIEGTVPSLVDITGCRFASRCPQYIGGECDEIRPGLKPVDDRTGHKVSCHLYTEISDSTPPWQVPQWGNAHE
ncbi:ABC transporter ATP-binding protein [Natrialbaceae archaeon A-CW2]